jgi:hypothetical protein
MANPIRALQEQANQASWSGNAGNGVRLLPGLISPEKCPGGRGGVFADVIHLPQGAGFVAKCESVDVYRLGQPRSP